MGAQLTREQWEWQDLELGMILRFDLPVFTNLAKRDWPRAGHLDPNLHNPTRLGTDQWLEAARPLTARYTVLVTNW